MGAALLSNPCAFFRLQLVCSLNAICCFWRIVVLCCLCCDRRVFVTLNRHQLFLFQSGCAATHHGQLLVNTHQTSASPKTDNLVRCLFRGVLFLRGVLVPQSIFFSWMYFVTFDLRSWDSESPRGSVHCHLLNPCNLEYILWVFTNERSSRPT